MLIINSKGLFKETKIATILEALLNLTISLILVNKIGLIGVLLGTIISKLLTSFLQNPHYIYNHIFKVKPIYYYLEYGLSLIISLIFIGIFNLLNLTISNVGSWLIYVLVTSLVVAISLFGIFYLCFQSFRNLTKRGIAFIKDHRYLIKKEA